MTSFGQTTAFFPGLLLALAATTALISGRAIDCRRGSRKLILARNESPAYYWLFVFIVAAAAALMIAEPAPVTW